MHCCVKTLSCHNAARLASACVPLESKSAVLLWGRPPLLSAGPLCDAKHGIGARWPDASLVAPPSPLRHTFIHATPNVTCFRSSCRLVSFRREARGSCDVSLWPISFAAPRDGADDQGRRAASGPADSDRGARAPATRQPPPSSSFGERLLQKLSFRWSQKFYGQVTFGPRNYPYPSSRWLARRFQMKKHRIIKRFRFRRYKLAAVANLPFAKMVRVGMLPELKSSKTKKGDTVDVGLASQLVDVAKSSTGGKVKGKRTRPKSKYQV